MNSSNLRFDLFRLESSQFVDDWRHLFRIKSFALAKAKMGSREGGESTSGPSNDNLLRFESHRLSTFSNWPQNSKVGAEKIAKAGFFYTGCYLEVKKCFFGL